MGDARDWWMDLPPVITAAAFVSLACGLMLTEALLMHYFSGKQIAQRDGATTEAGEMQHPWNWVIKPEFWATPIVTIAAPLFLLAASAFPALANLELCLGFTPTGLLDSEETTPLILLKPSILQAMGVLGTIVLWATAVIDQGPIRGGCPALA